MGTSSARRPPTTRLWRRAKGAATRYLAPAEGVGLEAREVVARYLAALGQEADPGSQGLLAEFRLTRKVGQNLGALLEDAASLGWDAALGDWGLTAEAEPGGGIPGPMLAGALLEADGGLEEAVARSALAAALQNLGSTEPVEPARLVRRFLAESIYQRLVLDLGASLEAAGRSYKHWRQGLEGLRACIIEAEALAEPEGPPPPAQWRGLAGWQWVTLVLEKILGRLGE